MRLVLLLLLFMSSAEAERLTVFSGTRIYTKDAKVAFTLPKGTLFQARAGETRTIKGEKYVRVMRPSTSCYQGFALGDGPDYDTPVYVKYDALKPSLLNPTKIKRGDAQIGFDAGILPGHLPASLRSRGLSVPRLTGATDRIVKHQKVRFDAKLPLYAALKTGVHKTPFGTLRLDESRGYQSRDIPGKKEIEVRNSCWRLRVELPNASINLPLTEKIRRQSNLGKMADSSPGFILGAKSPNLARGKKLYWRSGAYAGRVTKRFHAEFKNIDGKKCFRAATFPGPSYVYLCTKR